MAFKRSFYQQKNLMRAGARLMRMHTVNGMKWYLVPGGEVSEEIANNLIKEPDIKPGNDGMFPGISQTWGIIK